MRRSIPQLALAAAMILVPAGLAQAQYAPGASGPYFPRPAMPQYYQAPVDHATAAGQPGVQQVGNIVFNHEVAPGTPVEFASASQQAGAYGAQQTSHTKSQAVEARLAELEARLASYGKVTFDDHNGCSPCQSCVPACTPKKTGGIIAGGEFLLLKPHFGDNSVFNVLQADTGFTTIEDAGFNFDYQPAFRTYLGYVSAEGTGIVATYFHFHQSANPLAFAGQGPGTDLATFNYNVFDTPLGPGMNRSGLVQFDGEALDARYSLKVQTLDLEGLQELEVQNTTLTFTGGLRYMRLEHLASVAGAAFPDPVGSAAIGPLGFNADNTFEGLGPTVAIASRTPLFGSSLALTSMLRGSAVYGSQRERYFLNATDAGAQNVEFRSKDHDLVGVIELRLGAEYSRPVGAYRLFGRLGAEGQYYAGGGSPLTNGEVRDAASGNFGMVGYSFGAGIAR